MEFWKMFGKVVIVLFALALAAILTSCSSSLEVSSGVTSLDESYRARELALAQIAYLKESGDSVNRDQIRQIEEALTKQSVALLSNKEIERFELKTPETNQALALFVEFQATKDSRQFLAEESQLSPSTSLKGLIVNHLYEKVIVKVSGPRNWYLECSVKEQGQVEISLPSYGSYSVVFVSSTRKSEPGVRRVAPNNHYYSDNGVRYDFIATAIR